MTTSFKQRLEDFAYNHPTLVAFAIATAAVSALAFAYSIFAAGAAGVHYVHNDVAQVAFHSAATDAKPGCLYA
ncbi:hypothetical protein [Nitrososphaera viennensis]|uniref:Uncharacterized protein n=2 Tax=Nitrososphaera viennensis TaxID=1034015 RepID=A0A060HNB8_9ARCH|nr:hypothetical protein [Nitrososphaera viennensis]AIC14712.1 hypothetical protein NVIE_005160 [Nitrososphaera viennensis EN76]UVS69675.1 hypothetical protein NWT39_02535 [Nitrososphaera viennensis]